MPYLFKFDLTKISRSLFVEVARVAHRSDIHRRMSEAARRLISRFRIQELTGLNFSDAIQLMEDFIQIQIENLMNRELFLKASRKALLLPHCSRKYMDGRCKATFDPSVPSYICSHCSSDCLINQAVTIGEREGYDVYILPGGSCIREILRRGRYEAVVGVACGMEIKLASKALSKAGIAGQAVPLIKNGCANTKFNIETLTKVLHGDPKIG